MTGAMTLEQVAEAMVAPGKGILAADESDRHHQEAVRRHRDREHGANRRDYREMLFRSTDAMRNHISGVILYDETIRQKAKDGTPLTKVIEAAGALPGIKVDKGTKPLPLARARPSPKASTGWPSASRSTSASAPSSPSGAASYDIGRGCRATPRSAPTRRRWRATPPCAWRAGWCRSWSRSC